MSAAIGIIPPERCFPRKFHAYGVERDEAMLKVWETLADRGKALARKLDDRLDELRELGFRGAAEFMSMERGRLRAGTSDAELMQGKMDELQTTIEQVAGLAEVLKSFKDLAAERRTEISELLKSYRPEAGQMSEERQSVQRVVDLLGRIDDDWPPPGAGNLRTYLRRLQAFAEQSHAGRLRMRLAQIVGLPVISTSTLLDTDDVADIEEQWPVLWDEFARACREAVETVPGVGSDKLVVWMKEAIEKQTHLANLPSDERLLALDAGTRAWTTQVAVRPSEVADVLASRGRVRQLLANLSRSVGNAVIDEIVEVSANAAAGEAYSVLEDEAQRFHDEVEKVAGRLSEVVGGLRRPFPGETCAAVLAEFEVARRTSEDKWNELHERILSLGRVLERLGGRAKPIPSPLTVPEAQRLVNAELEAVTILLGQAWQRVTERLSKLGLDHQLGQRIEGATPEDEVVCVESDSVWCDLAEKEVSTLVAMGAYVPELAGESREGVLQRLSADVSRWQKQLKDVNECVRVIRLRLLRLGCPVVDEKQGLFSDIKDGTNELIRLNAELDLARGIRLAEASERAQGLYKELLSDGAGENSESSPFRELRSLGLIRAIEDDL